MKHNIRKSWVTSFELLINKPKILFPFLILAFFQSLALEFIYFFPRKPLMYIANPIIRKYFGEVFIHYPNNLLLLPKVFYYVQILLYIVIGVFLTAISINIFKNIKSNLPLKTKALIKNALKRYGAFFVYGVLIMVLLSLLKRVDILILSKIFRFGAQYVPNLATKLYPLITPFFLFLTNLIMQVFLILAVPIIVIQKSSLFKALAKSIYLGARNFFGLFALISVPFLLYLPIFLLKNFSFKLVDITFPEINLYVTGAGILVALFVNCFVIICVSQFLLEEE